MLLEWPRAVVKGLRTRATAHRCERATKRRKFGVVERLTEEGLQPIEVLYGTGKHTRIELDVTASFAGESRRKATSSRRSFSSSHPVAISSQSNLISINSNGISYSSNRRGRRPRQGKSCGGGPTKCRHLSVTDAQLQRTRLIR